MDRLNGPSSANDLTIVWSRLLGLFHGHTLIQTEQWHPFLAHQLKHFMARTGHFNMPVELETSQAVSMRGLDERARLGQYFEQSLHTSQNFWIPMSIGRSGLNGKSVKTLLIRTRGPNSLVISSPCLPNSPNPASTAIGMLMPSSLPLGMAR